VDTAVPLSDVVNGVLGDDDRVEDLSVEDDDKAAFEGFGLMAGLDDEVDWSSAGSLFSSESATADWDRWDAVSFRISRSRSIIFSIESHRLDRH